MRYVGIDVSAKELSVVILDDKKTSNVRTFENTPQDHKKVIAYISCKQQLVTQVCLEATGVYHFDLAVALSKAHNIEVMVVNPKATKHFSEALMMREKSDLKDAEMLALYVQRMGFVLWKCPGDAELQVRAYARRLEAVTHHKAQVNNQLHALEASDYTPAAIVKDVKKEVEFLEKAIAKLQKEVLTLISQNQQIHKYYNLLLTVKGIGVVSAMQLLGELLVLPANLTNRQWVAMAGLDPRKHESGSSVSKKPRISKAGNRRLRKALYMPALSATNHDPYVKGYYEHLIQDRGLKKMQALCAVMRKLLHAIHGMLSQETAFDNTRFYPALAKVLKQAA